jgi:hypothetical protein
MTTQCRYTFVARATYRTTQQISVSVKVILDDVAVASLAAPLAPCPFGIVGRQAWVGGRSWISSSAGNRASGRERPTPHTGG